MAVDISGAVAWLYSRQKFGIVPGLERTERTLAALGHPQRELLFIHVAGTNGKGSVCATMAAVLMQQFSVGLFVSPGFDGLRGRFFISDTEMDDATFAALAAQVRKVSEQATPDDPLTEFEVLTVMAICYFAQSHVDMVVWETGLGGSYDSTNVVSPEVTVITNVSLDHQQILGHTVREIAAQKAGIIKEGIPIVTAATGESLDVIRSTARTRNAPLYCHGIEYSVSRLAFDATQQVVAYRGRAIDRVMRIGLVGRHQVHNAGIALMALELFMWKQPKFRLSWETIQAGLLSTQWPGRCELLKVADKTVVLDGAHNPAGAKVLAETLRELTDGQAIPAAWTLVVGVLADKAVTDILKELVPLAKHIIVTQPNNQRALPIDDLWAQVTALFSGEVSKAPSVAGACEMALMQSGPVCCCGSLYTVFEARKTITEQFCLGQN